MRSVHPEERPWRIRARFALNWAAAASGQISATFHANSARAARLNEPVATLSGLVQTGICIHPSPASEQSSASIETASAVNPTKSIRTDLADLPEPLTASGAAQACPIRLRSRRNAAQLSQTDWLCPPVPFLLAPSFGRAAGKWNRRLHLPRPLDRSSRKHIPDLLEAPFQTRRIFSPSRSLFPFRATVRIALFPGKSAGGPLTLIFLPLLRVSGTLRKSDRISNSLTNNPDTRARGDKECEQLFRKQKQTRFGHESGITR
jgi:hypothetical protein